MNIQEVLFYLFIFIAVFSLIIFFISVFKGSILEKRIKQLGGVYEKESEEDSAFLGTLIKVVAPISKLSLPKEGWEGSPIATSFLNAGWRSPNTPILYFGIKTFLVFALPIIAYLFIDRSVQANSPSEFMFILVLAAAFGYYTPNVIMTRVTKSRQQEIVNNLPDATDLLLICVEAGLSFEQALDRVASEIKIKSKTLSEELSLVIMEVRSGFNRQKSLKNLALRTGVEQVDTLATMINQSERFGTSIGDSLRVYADTARTKRRQKAEEEAAKIAVKMIFPLMFCLFPVMFIVLLTPALVNILTFFSES